MMLLFCCEEEYGDAGDSSDGEKIGKPIIIDTGSRICRVGFSGDKNPKTVLTTVVGKPRMDLSVDDGTLEDMYIGEEALARSGLLTLTYPIDRGVVQDWDMIEDIWHHAFFSILEVKPSEHFVLLTEVPLSPKATRERTAAIMFETFHVLGIYITSAAVLALYEAGGVTGCVLDCGDGSAYAVAIFKGYPLPHALERLNLGGRDVTKCLMKLINDDHDADPLTNVDFEALNTWKEEMCYVALDFDEEMKMSSSSSLHKNLVLPKRPGKQLVVGSERFRAPEILFTPVLSNDQIDCPGIHRLVVKTITNCPIDVRKELYNNIVICGGSTLTPGFVERLEKEITVLSPELSSVRVEALENRWHSGWAGGAVLTDISHFQEHWVTWSDYTELGVEAVHRCDKP